MTSRWQSTEVRSSAVFLDDDQGVPLTGLSPTAAAVRKDTGAALPAPTVTELGLGFYRVDLPAAAFDQLVRVAYTSGGVTRYVGQEVERGGWVDLVDAATTSRSTPAQVTAATAGLATASALAALVTAVGTPAQAAALASLASTVGSPAQAAALATLAAAMGTPAQAPALASALATLRADVATRATPADVQTSVTVAPPVSGRVG